MPTRTFSEISELVQSLEQEFKTLKTDAQNRYDLYTLRKEPTLPEDITREGQVNILSPLLIHSAHAIRSDLMSNPTEFSVIPMARDNNGGIPVRDQKHADTLERALASLWSRLNEGRRVDREIIWHQLMSPFGVMVLELNDMSLPEPRDNEEDTDYAERLDRHRRTRQPWSIKCPDPLTCFFAEKDGKPTLFGRRYKVLAHEIQKQYSKNRNAVAPDLNLRLNNGHWEWMSDDYVHESFKQTATDQMREIEMLWLDDGEHIYHVALNAADSKGEVIWESVNPFGRVSAFLVPSSLTPLREPEDRYEPFLWPLMQTVKDLNYIRSIRATTSRNLAGPNQYIPLDPSIIQIFENAQKELPRTHRWRRGEIPYLLGQILEQPQKLDPDLDKLEVRLAEDLQRFLPSQFVHIIDPAVLKAATATSILHAAESGMRMYGPLMSAYDAAIRDVMESVIHCITNYFDDEPVYTYSTGEEVAHGKNLKEGMVFSLTEKDLNFSYRITVKTRSMTQAQASAQYEMALSQWMLPDGSKGPATIDDLIDAANYSDKEAQKEKLASEAILSKIDPWIQEMAIASAIAEIQQDLGIVLPPMNAGAGAPAQTPAGLPNTAQRMDAPMVAGPEGGTSPI